MREPFAKIAITGGDPSSAQESITCDGAQVL
jgi:hypothetical protein